MPLEPDPRDIIDIPGVAPPGGGDGAMPAGPIGRPWLSIWFRCCHAYARVYRNAAGTGYEGACPRCGARVRASIGPGGTARRFFEAS